MVRKRHIDTPPPEPSAPAAAPANDQRDTFFTIPELAERWRVSRHTVTGAIKSGRLHAFKVGERVYRIRHDEVLRYEQQHMARAS